MTMRNRSWDTIPPVWFGGFCDSDILVKYNIA